MTSPTIPHPDVIRQAVELPRFPWIRPLVTAHATQYASVASLFAGDPARPDAWTERSAVVARSARHRDAIAAVLAAQLDRRGAPDAARHAASTLASPAAVAVITGQQAGLFGGPLYTLLKAITAIQLARRVTHQGTPAVAVFWVESEDHDWAEVKSARILDGEGGVRDITLSDLTGAGTQPVAALKLDEGINDALAALEEALAPSEFRDQLLAGLRKAYRPGAGMATAFASWLDSLLGAHGLIVFEADDPAAKPLVADLFRAEIENPARTSSLVREAAARMRQLGHEPQVEPADDSTALFHFDADGRRAIKRKDSKLVSAGGLQEPAALAAEAAAHPERFSPNVLLRPLVQDRLFPTVCYVGGPSELAYQAQLGGVYRAFGVEPPLLCSRVSATLLDSAALKFLDRYHLPFETLAATDDSTLNQLLVDQMPPAIERAFDEAMREVTARVAAIHDAVPAVDPTLAGAADTTRERMLESLKTLHAKVIQASKRKDETLRRQFQRTRTLAFPGGDPQERALALVFFLNRYGPGLIDRLLEVLPSDGAKHYVLGL